MYVVLITRYVDVSDKLCINIYLRKTRRSLNFNKQISRRKDEGLQTNSQHKKDQSQFRRLEIFPKKGDKCEIKQKLIYHIYIYTFPKSM